MSHFSSCYNTGFVRLWIGLLHVFGSKSVHTIFGISSGIDPGRSVQISGLGSYLVGLPSDAACRRREEPKQVNVVNLISSSMNSPESLPNVALIA